MSELFDQAARRRRRDRARRAAGDSFLADRLLDDLLDRLAPRRFARALLTGCLDPRCGKRLQPLADRVETTDEPLATLTIEPGSFDLVVSLGDLAAADDLPLAAFVLRAALAPGGTLAGAIVGGASLPRLAAAMHAADRLATGASPRLHPRLDGPTLAGLIGATGLANVVVEVERVDVAYRGLDRLVDDLRAMGCTNVLADRSRRPLGRAQLAAARAAFLDGGARAIERFELLHFLGTAPR